MMRDDRLRQERISEVYYRWSMKNAVGQLEAGFPLVSAVDTFVVEVFLHWVDNLTKSQALDLIRGLVKRAHEGVADKAGDPILEAERREIERWITHVGERIALGHRDSGRNMSDASMPIRRSDFAKKLRSDLTPICGKAENFSGRLVWRHTTHLDGYIFDTLVDVGGRYAGVVCEHWLRLGERRLLSNISTLSAFGIAGGTRWDVRSLADVDTVGAGLKQTCALFVESLFPGLVQAIKN